METEEDFMDFVSRWTELYSRSKLDLLHTKKATIELMVNNTDLAIKVG